LVGINSKQQKPAEEPNNNIKTDDLYEAHKSKLTADNYRNSLHMSLKDIKKQGLLQRNLILMDEKKICALRND
jgi:hypothetical protein